MPLEQSIELVLVLIPTLACRMPLKPNVHHVVWGLGMGSGIGGLQGSRSALCSSQSMQVL